MLLLVVLDLTFVLALTVGGNPVRISTGNAAISAIDTGTTLIGSIPFSDQVVS